MAMRAVGVSDLNRYIKNLIYAEPLLSNITVTGEISSWKKNSRSGAVFFTLKDENSQLECVMWQQSASKLTIPYEVGMMVNIHGKVDYWNNVGKLKFNAVFMEPAGEGQLNARYEKLKAQLMQEGIFDPQRKKALPFFPENIAVVTSPEGSAAFDIKKTITEKNNYVNIYLYPVKVQGQGAAAQIAKAISDINISKKGIDVIITGRGGGSPEERWAFNEEIVVRSIAASSIPVITGIGHEDNESLADLAADHYAKTPTAAASAAVPDTDELKSRMEMYFERTDRQFIKYIQFTEQKLCNMYPDKMKLKMRLRSTQDNIFHMINQLRSDARAFIKDKEQQAELEKTRLYAAGPENIMNHGYCLLEDEKGHLVTSVSGIDINDSVSITLSDGIIKSRVSSVSRFTENKE